MEGKNGQCKLHVEGLRTSTGASQISWITAAIFVNRPVTALLCIAFCPGLDVLTVPYHLFSYSQSMLSSTSL